MDCQEDSAMISNHTLVTALLTAPMRHYFKLKLPHLPEQELLVQIEEALKFLVIADQCTGAIPISKEIDEIWHYWILQTEEYMTLCEQLPTGNYIHHSSNDYSSYFDSAINERSNLTLDIKMLALYVKNFGSFEKKRTQYWLLAAHLIEKRGWTLQQLNDWLQMDEAACKSNQIPISQLSC